MSWADALDKLSRHTKSIVVSIIVLVPFWFISIYLFNKPLFNSANYFVIGAFCFCFSLTWYFIGFIPDAIKTDSLKSKSANEPDLSTTLGGVRSVMFLSAFICIEYFLKWNFIYFLVGAYIFMILRCIYAWIKDEWKKMLHTKRSS